MLRPSDILPVHPVDFFSITVVFGINDRVRSFKLTLLFGRDNSFWSFNFLYLSIPTMIAFRSLIGMT
uniref:Uncharacterized protein n=1 Tax=Salmonella sp. TaxID=599 RepID=A0A482ET29_SALSP|nr:hypothetical protein NNIBIDOC_00004 [Salmonella sp.]